MIDALLTRPVTIVTRADSGTDELGNVTFTDTETVTVGELQQRRRSETPDGGLAETSWTLFLPAGTAIGANDRVQVDGDTFEVDGDPWPVRNPRSGADSHVEATLRRASAPGDQ